MKTLFISFFLFFVTSVTLAQDGLGYYHDQSNYFYVFDKGISRQLENYHVDTVYVGNNYLSYMDQKNSLIVYYNGDKQTLEETKPDKIIATGNVLVYRMQRRLMIFENGNSRQLAEHVDSFFAGDSIIVWQALPSLDLMAYENGEIKTIEPAVSISNNVISDGLVGKNIFAFNDLAYNFKIYYNGKVYNTESTRITDYKCAENIVAWIDNYKNTLNVFYNGETKVISDQIMNSYAVCDDMVAYLDANNNFSIYYQGAITPIDSYAPDYYYAQDNIIYYSYHSELKIIYDGTIYKDRLVPQNSISIGINSLLYLDQTNRPKYFYEGTMKSNILFKQPNAMWLSRDLPVFRYDPSTIGFLYNGQLFEYGCRDN
ncbi:MAG: hypothetical protein ACXVPU_14030 [Bacteroidia bacterium]